MRTGDLGRVDEQGRLRLAGRSKEMYVRGGYNVYPIEVEAVLAEHPDVAAVAVVRRARPGDGRGGRRRRRAPRRARATRARATCARSRRGRLAAYKLPEELRLVDALPLTAMEKVDRTSDSERSVAETPPAKVDAPCCSRTGRGGDRRRAGIGREFALCLAREGANVVVNDVGAALDGEGADDSPAAQVCKEIEALGGQAVPAYDSVSDFEAAGRIIGDRGRRRSARSTSSSTTPASSATAPC